MPADVLRLLQDEVAVLTTAKGIDALGKIESDVSERHEGLRAGDTVVTDGSFLLRAETAKSTS